LREITSYILENEDVWKKAKQITMSFEFTKGPSVQLVYPVAYRAKQKGKLEETPTEIHDKAGVNET